MKTQIHAEDGSQEILITRAFNLPLKLLFKAYIDPDLVSQWMGTKVLKLESKNHGSWQFETTDKQGNVVFRANGVIHEMVPLQKIVRTFQMENTPFPAQLEFLEFTKITENTSKLNMHIIYKTIADRNKTLQLPFAQGINMTHNRLEKIMEKVK